MNTKKSKYRKMLRLQEAQEWDIEADIHWNNHHQTWQLIPNCQGFAKTYLLNDQEQVVFSQFLGLMAVKAISQHEKILASVQEDCWRKPLQKKNSNCDYRELGEQFFKEEAKHSKAFAKYIDVFAASRNMDINELNSILPEYKNSWMASIFKWNSKLGGRAIWWLVMITEEESLALFRSIRSHKKAVDPLFYELNECHFQEEIRHSSYAPLMLRELTASKMAWPFKFDFILANLLHKVWIGLQIWKLRKVTKLEQSHPFFGTLNRVYKKINRLSLRKKLSLLRNDIPVLSQVFDSSRHRAIAIELQRNPDLRSLRRGLQNVY